MSFLSGFEISKPEGFNVEFEGIVNFDFGIHKMKPNQKIVYSYINERWFILSEPPGAGKSTSIKFVVSELLRKNPKLKVIIAVPQTLISKSFGSIILEYPNGDKVEWDISNNLCDKIGSLDKIGELNNFINRNEFGNNPADRIAMVTHITLSKLNTEGEDFNDVMFIIDEGHHVLYPENGGTESANKIGALVHYIMNQKKSNAKIWFATATFYRGDKSNIIPPEEMEKFTTYHLPLDEYWRKYIKYIQSFSYNFVMYKNRDVFSEIKEIFKQKGKRKTIIFCPYIGYLVNNMNKFQFRDKVIETIKEVWEDCKFLDLIEIEDRYDKKQIVINDSEDFDVVLSVKLFDEGTDWVKAESIIDLCPSNSLRIQVQRFGRLLRDIYGKTHIDYNVFLPHESKFKDDEERRLHMSRSFNAFTASCLLHEAIEPIIKPVVKNNIESKPSPLVDLGLDDSKRQDLIAKVAKDLMFLKNIVDTPSITESKECIINSIKDFGIINNIEEVVEYVVKTLRRSSIPKTTEWESQTIDISWMIEKGFDKVWDDSMYDSLISFSTGVCNVETFKEFREIYYPCNIRKQHIKDAEKLAKENGGILPPPSELCKLGKNHLASYIYKFPEHFKHIQLYNQKDFINRYVLLAKKLAEKNNGILDRDDIQKNKRLQELMWRSPESFNHFKLSPTSLELHQQDAENLAKQNGGELYNFAALKRMGKNNLCSTIQKYPNKFKHLKMNNTRITPDQHVKDAENLAKQNGGMLPCKRDLRLMNKAKLVSAIFRYPDKFKHISILPTIKKKRNLNAVVNYVKEAESLIDHTGFMNKSGLSATNIGLYYAMRNNPDKFKHINHGFKFIPQEGFKNAAL